jgi:DNA-binding transcriptional MerR regulator
MLHAAPKSPEAFRTISEVADELEVPQHVLRFWETKFGAVKPLKRGGGRRYYRPDDVDLLRGIRFLLYSDGLTIKGVQKVLRQRGVRYVIELGRASLSLLESLAPQATKDPQPMEAAPSNIRPFPSPKSAGPGEEQRLYLASLLGELEEMKAKLFLARQAGLLR